MAFLDIDTDVLRQTVSMAKRTNDAITEAMNYLNQVVIHNDWMCKERYTINDHTVENRTLAQTIQGWSSNFYSAIDNASQLFDDTEKAAITEMDTLDEAIGRIPRVDVGGFTEITSFPDIGALQS